MAPSFCGPPISRQSKIRGTIRAEIRGSEIRQEFRKPFSLVTCSQVCKNGMISRQLKWLAAEGVENFVNCRTGRSSHANSATSTKVPKVLSVILTHPTAMINPMRVLIVAGVMLITAIFIGFGGMALFKSPAWMAHVFFGIGSVLGLWIGVLLLRLITPKRKAPTAHRIAAPAAAAIPFHRRLSHFMTIVHTADQDGERSPMPIWSLRQNHHKTPPKSSGFIREILLRIRTILSRQ